MQIGGIDANQIVTDLMALERRPLGVLEARQADAERAAQSLSGIRTNVDAYRFAALKLAGSDTFGRFSTNSSNSSAVVASAGSTAVPSTLSFTVSQLASNHGLRSVGTVAASDSQITSATTLSIATGGPANGIGMVRSGAGLTAGEHDITITQSSAAAVKQGDAALAGATLGVDETLTLSVDGTSATINIAAGTYTAQELADAVDAGLTGAGLAASASLDADGRLNISTDGEGSAATVQVTGGTALTRLQLTTDGAARTGTDAVLTIGGTTTTISDVRAGTTTTVPTGSGDLELDLTGGLRVGTMEVTTVDLGDGSLSAVASAINGANADVSAAAIRVAEGQWRLQLTSQTSGEDGEILLDGDQFTGLGGLIESSTARNAQLTIGEGAGAYTVESSSNTFDDVMTGTSITVSAVTTDPVTVSVERDNAKLASDVGALVSAANNLLAEIKVQTRFGVDGIGNGALAGNSTVRRMADQLRNALSRPVEGFGELIGADVGIEIDRDGSFTFDSAAFTAAMEENPGAVERFFGRAATTPAGVSFGDATPETISGSYDVEVTTAATQATSARLFDGGAVTATRLGIRVGDVTTTVEIAAGQSAASIIDAVNGALADTGLDITAEADATGLVLRSDEWGSAGDFEVNTDVAGVGTWDAVAGTDVEGTIDGLAATGIGRTLSLNSLTDSPAAGLSLEIDGGLTGALGAVEYQPGVAARVAEVTTQILAEDGTFDSAQDAQQRRIDDFNDEIDRFEDRLFSREQTLRAQWSRLQTVIAGLQERSSWISSQIASLPQIQA